MTIDEKVKKLESRVRKLETDLPVEALNRGRLGSEVFDEIQDIKSELVALAEASRAQSLAMHTLISFLLRGGVDNIDEIDSRLKAVAESNGVDKKTISKAKGMIDSILKDA